MLDITLIFFVYGLAFFSMGLAMLFEAGRSPIFSERRVLIPLSIFGFVHGSHEWLEMFLEKSTWIEAQNPGYWAWLRIAILMVSFVALIIFGLQVVQPQTAFAGPGRYIWIVGLAGYILLILIFGLQSWGQQENRVGSMDALARYSLAIPGAVIAGVALFREASRSIREGISSLASILRAAGSGFLIYAATQFVVSPHDFFPANAINTDSFLALTGLPIQLIRAAIAVLITISLIRATQITEDARKRQLLAVQHSRMEALEQLDEELHNREAMRQELLKHIVQAQEEERARIAIELHDGTSQTLTAFTFHLAAIQKILGSDSRVEEQLKHLRNLSRQMAAGIYRLVHDLRPAQLDDLGLVAALHYLCDAAEGQMGLKVKLEVSGILQRLDPITETAIFRIAQEALTNIARHAAVQEALMGITFDPDQVILRISDQGVGFELDNIHDGGWGLKGIRERSDSIGAKLRIRSSPQEGTEIEVLVDLEKKSEVQITNNKESSHNGIDSFDVG